MPEVLLLAVFGQPMPQPFDCLRREGIQLTRMDGARGKALVFLSGGRAFDSPQWWTFCRGFQWTNRGVALVCR